MENIKTVTSVSGGMTSAYLAANYPSDKLVFSLVRSKDKYIKFKDPFLRREVEDRLQKPFVATLEDDIIIKTILDLELYLGRKIDWVSGPTYEDLIFKIKGGYLPNRKDRFCTTELKIRPIFDWWAETFKMMPVYMNIGYRASEKNRVDRENKKLNGLGLSTFKHSFKKNKKGQNSWGEFAWRFPKFPLFEDLIFKGDIIKFWADKPVKFANRNNCVACFHRSPQALKISSLEHPDKFDWFCSAERMTGATWKKGVRYDKIKLLSEPMFLNEDSEGCDSGFCGF